MHRLTVLHAPKGICNYMVSVCQLSQAGLSRLSCYTQPLPAFKSDAYFRDAPSHALREPEEVYSNLCGI